MVVLLLVVGVAQAGIYRSLQTEVALRAELMETARLAMINERQRIARDVHDIVGQKLAAVTLSAERAAECAECREDMTELAEIARSALVEMRSTVSGYRTTTLSAEVRSARRLLAAACVELSTYQRVPAPTARLDDLVGVLVREGTTNIVRHAEATRCQLRIDRAGDDFIVELRDDGAGGAAGQPVSGGGLAGLAERVAVEGGSLDALVEDDWFVLRARLRGATASRSAERLRRRGERVRPPWRDLSSRLR
jgi:two-component system sensor histidine kinase DesK